MSHNLPGLLPTPDELQEQAADWSLLALLLEPPRPGWRTRLEEASRTTLDPELQTAVAVAQREGNEYFYDCLFGPEGLLAARESAYRDDHDRQPLISDLRGMAKAYGFYRFGSEPADHIASLAGFMAHLLGLQRDAMAGDRVGEAPYLEGAVEWVRRAHLAWFTERLARALAQTEVCYLLHVAHALEARVYPPGESPDARSRPSDVGPELGSSNLKDTG